LQCHTLSTNRKVATGLISTKALGVGLSDVVKIRYWFEGHYDGTDTGTGQYHTRQNIVSAFTGINITILQRKVGVFSRNFHYSRVAIVTDNGVSTRRTCGGGISLA
jgi:hypothetical protein